MQVNRSEVGDEATRESCTLSSSYKTSTTTSICSNPRAHNRKHEQTPCVHPPGYMAVLASPKRDSQADRDQTKHVGPPIEQRPDTFVDSCEPYTILRMAQDHRCWQARLISVQSPPRQTLLSHVRNFREARGRAVFSFAHSLTGRIECGGRTG